MPVRSSTSSVITWPTHDEVLAALTLWAKTLTGHHPEVLAIGLFGSYAKGNCGVGSDLDLIVITQDTGLPVERRNLNWPLEDLPVPADTVVLTQSEWQGLQARDTRFARTLREETVWVWPAPT
jgi:predicted nucleotidyltransferase